jgi:hypothetical protein
MRNRYIAVIGTSPNYIKYAFYIIIYISYSDVFRIT